ncbi:RNA-processing protein, partial [bacterium]|nr:RNA-processing protein [bacterium]
VFIGREGSQKDIFQKEFNCKINVNSENGEVLVEEIEGYNDFLLSNIINAINYGHSPENSLLLVNESYVFDIIDVKNLVKNHDRLKIVMGRIIGKNGSTRKAIEQITKCHVAVKDTYVSVIGPFENTLLVHEALNMLISGASHKSFYSYLEKNKINSNMGFYL